jgi:hypothetical protein
MAAKANAADANAANANKEVNTIIGEGWKALVNHLGLQGAVQFVVLLERGKGDTVQEIAEYWGDASIDEIYARVARWKTEVSR